MTCPVCKSDNGCKGKGYELYLSRYKNWLNADDWRRIYEFMKHVYYPFIHSILAEAERRQKDGHRRRKV